MVGGQRRERSARRQTRGGARSVGVTAIETEETASSATSCRHRRDGRGASGSTRAPTASSAGRSSPASPSTSGAGTQTSPDTMPTASETSRASSMTGVSRLHRAAHARLSMTASWAGPSRKSSRRAAARRIDSGRGPPHSEPTTAKGALMAKPSTIRELRDSGYAPRTVKQELRDNLIARIRRGEGLFTGIVGYEQTVVPQIENAVLSGQDIVFLGERGQAKTRMARLLVGVLDEEMPALAGCEISDEPFAPICSACRQRVAEQGDRAPIAWIPRDRRYGEKLATPDITIADLIGEVDPIKVAEGRYLADELTNHYGLLPRTNRGIFALNELPDLAERIQVGLLNILEERDVQIRGFVVRLPLDLYMVASANPEDYTSRGRIITPLKDRLGSQLLTHYPRTLEHEMAIVRQEKHRFEAEEGTPAVVVPAFMEELVA